MRETGHCTEHPAMIAIAAAETPAWQRPPQASVRRPPFYGGAVEEESQKRVKALLTVVGTVFEEYGEWPTRQYVEAELEQDFRLDLDDCLNVTPSRLVAAGVTGEDGQIALRVAGLAEAGLEKTVGRFVEAIRWCVTELGGSRPTHPGQTEEVRVDSEQFRSEWSSRGVEVNDLDLKKLAAMIRLEGNFAGFSGEGHKWSILLSRRVFRPYRDVETVEDYLDIRAEMERPAIPPTPPLLSVAQGGSLDLEGGLPAIVASRCAKLIRDQHWDAAALEAIKVMADLLRERSGLRLDGEALAGKALSPPNPVVPIVGIGDTHGDGVQRGVMLIAQGLFHAARNPLAHASLRLSRDEAMEVIAAVGFVIRGVERGTPDDEDGHPLDGR
jgi:uncharacterized protein (TIGR02391 family)